jgi:CRP-like cAMP-binding protein
MKQVYDYSIGISGFLAQKPGIAPEEALAFALLWQKTKVLSRGDFLCAPGKIEQHVWFVNEGVLRLYYPTETEEICVGFAYTNNIVCSFPSYIRQQPSAFSIQALSKCHVCGISRTDLRMSIEKWPSISRFWTNAVEMALANIIEREIEIHTTSPIERYENLLLRAPHIFQLVPLRYIATYLRIQPETLSRIRNKS